MGWILRQQRRRGRGAAGARLVVKAASLLIDPDVARREPEDQAAPALGIAIIRSCVDVEPDVLHVSEVAAQLANELVARAGRAPSGPLHHLEGFKLRPTL